MDSIKATNGTVELSDVVLAATEAYKQGFPVVIWAKEGFFVHGEEELKAIASGDCAVPVVNIFGVDASRWNHSDCPELVEAARRFYFLAVNSESVEKPGEQPEA
jgi:hypothetical protein